MKLTALLKILGEVSREREGGAAVSGVAAGGHCGEAAEVHLQAGGGARQVQNPKSWNKTWNKTGTWVRGQNKRNGSTACWRKAGTLRQYYSTQRNRWLVFTAKAMFTRSSKPGCRRQGRAEEAAEPLPQV